MEQRYGLLRGSLELRSGILIETRTRSDKRSLRYTLLDFAALKKKVPTEHRLAQHTRRQLALFVFFSGPAHQTLNTLPSVSDEKEEKRRENFHISFMRWCDHQTINQPAPRHNASSGEIFFNSFLLSCREVTDARICLAHRCLESG